MKLTELLKDVETLSRFDGDREVEKIASQSLDACEKTLFIAIDSESNKDGRFTKEAREKGSLIITDRDPEEGDIAVKDASLARAIIWRNYYGDPQKALTLHAVTGTNGKTTVTYLLRHILEKCGRRTGIIGTVANMTGDDVMPSVRTTPPPDELYKLLDKMRKNRLSDVCMEISSHSLVQKRASALFFKSGAVTNLTRDHLDYHGNMENYLAAKLLLVPLCENFAYNADDSYASAFANTSKECKGQSLSYGISAKNCDLTARKLYQSREKTVFTLCYNGEERETEINIPGRFSVYNSLTAVSLALLSGISLDKAAEHLSTAGGIKGRMERIETKDGVTVVIDYAHTPDGLEKVLVALRDVKGKGKIITVFGCGGDRDKTKRPVMGEIAARLSDLVIITSDNPRSEDPYAIIEEIAAGAAFLRTPKLIIEDRKSAIRTAMSNASKGDIVLLAGKGHETYQILKDRIIDFDERELLKEYI